jgi:hypothetical protein
VTIARRTDGLDDCLLGYTNLAACAVITLRLPSPSCDGHGHYTTFYFA